METIEQTAIALSDRRSEVWQGMDELIRSAGEKWDEKAQASYTELEGEYRSLSDRLDAISRHKERNKPAGAPAETAGGEPDESEARSAAFNQYLRRGADRLTEEQRTLLIGDTEQRAQDAGTGSEGGYLVAQEFRTKLVEVRKAFGGLAGAADSFTTATGAKLTYPTLNDTSNEGAITAEDASFNGGADLVFGEVELGAYKYTTLGAGDAPLKVSVELVQDSAFNIEQLVSRAFGRRIARQQAIDWVTGEGTTEPLGLLSQAGAGAAPDVGAIDAIGDLTYAKLLNIEGALDPEYRVNAKWLMNDTVWQGLRALVDGDGRPIILPQADAGAGGKVPLVLLGYPVVIDQAAPSPAADTLSVAFGDLVESYVIRRVADLRVIVDPYSFATIGKIGYVAWERADGTIQNRESYVTAGHNT